MSYHIPKPYIKRVLFPDAPRTNLADSPAAPVQDAQNPAPGDNRRASYPEAFLYRTTHKVQPKRVPEMSLRDLQTCVLSGDTMQYRFGAEAADNMGPNDILYGYMPDEEEDVTAGVVDNMDFDNYDDTTPSRNPKARVRFADEETDDDDDPILPESFGMAAEPVEANSPVELPPTMNESIEPDEDHDIDLVMDDYPAIGGPDDHFTSEEIAARTKEYMHVRARHLSHNPAQQTGPVQGAPASAPVATYTSGSGAQPRSANGTGKAGSRVDQIKKQPPGPDPFVSPGSNPGRGRMAPKSASLSAPRKGKRTYDEMEGTTSMAARDAVREKEMRKMSGMGFGGFGMLALEGAGAPGHGTSDSPYSGGKKMTRVEDEDDDLMDEDQ